MNDLRCYCCGKDIGATFSLVTMQAPSDRVFVMLNEHVERIDDDNRTIVQVTRDRKPPIKRGWRKHAARA